MSDIIKIAIVEDEDHNRETLLEYLNIFDFNFEIVGHAANIKEGEKLLLTHHIDLLFLDMKLPDGEGIDLLDKISPIGFRTIFFTAHKDYALSAFEHGSVDYLLKPLDLTAFKRAMTRFVNETNGQPAAHEASKVVKIPHKEGTLFLETDEIIYLQAYGEYCHLITTDKKLMVSTTLKDLEGNLPSSDFCRVHRSYVINMNKIKFYQKKGIQKVILSNGDEIPISRRKRDFVESLLSK